MKHKNPFNTRMDKMSVQTWVGIQPQREENHKCSAVLEVTGREGVDLWLWVSGGMAMTLVTLTSWPGSKRERTDQSPTTLQGHNLKTYPKHPIPKGYIINPWCHPGDQPYIL